jgi:exopolysaccharide production protein ExoQ
MAETFDSMPRRQLVPASRSRDWITLRNFEIWGAAAALFFLSGALFPLLVMGHSDSLDESQRSLLRLVSIPAYVFAIVLLLRYRKLAYLALRQNLLLAALIALPFVSTLWSISPSITLRRSVGLLLSMAVGYVLSIRFSPRQLLVVVSGVLGFCIALSLLVAAVAPGLGFMPGDTALRGAFTHKNGLGQIASLAVVLAGALILDPDRNLRRGGLVLLGPALACLVMSQSATSIFAAVIALGAACFYTVLARTSGLARTVLALIVIQISAVILLLLAAYLAPLLHAIGKDATLTGRVPLWALVDRDIAARPLTGYGYEAFWTSGNAEMWRIWGAIGWAAPNAHSGFRQSLLNFGLVGTVLLGLTFVRAFWEGSVLHDAAPHEGWLWMNVLLVMVLSVNLTESQLMLQNDLLWVLLTAIMSMFSIYRPSKGGMGR